MRERFVCPFCRESVAEVGLFYDLAAVEATLRAHVRERHPLRWRLSRRWRAAMSATAR